MFKVIRSNSKAKLESMLVEIKAERRAALKRAGSQIDIEYRDLVVKQTRIEEKIYDEVSTFVLEELGLDGSQFQRTQEAYMT